MPARYSSWPGRTGAKVTPQLPRTTVVTPCQHEELAAGSQNSWASRWVWMSTNPGVTSRPLASISRRAPAGDAADLGDAVAVDGDIGPDRAGAGPVDHVAVTDHDVVHGPGSFRRDGLYRQ